MSEIRSNPCQACPYRCDVPSGVWSAEEYEKLLEYEGETYEQSIALFACHATPEYLCSGWAAVSGQESLALRAHDLTGEIPEPTIPLFGSHREAAEHGMRDVEEPSLEARLMIARLIEKHPRLAT